MPSFGLWAAPVAIIRPSLFKVTTKTKGWWVGTYLHELECGYGLPLLRSWWSKIPWRVWCNSSSFRKLLHSTYFCCYFFVFFYIVCQIQWSSSHFLVLWSILWFDVDKLPVFSEENGAFDILYKSRQTLVDRFYYRPAHAQP